MYRRVLLVVLILAGIAGTALRPGAQESRAVPTAPAATPSPAAAPSPEATPPPTSAPTDDQLREFVPREKIGADSAVAFPVDI